MTLFSAGFKMRGSMALTLLACGIHPTKHTPLVLFWTLCIYICFAKSMWLWFNNQVKSGICHHASLRLHYVCLYTFTLPFMCTEWPDRIVCCKLQRSWQDCWASAQERSWCKPSDKGETFVCAPQTVLIWIFFTMIFEICKVSCALSIQSIWTNTTVYAMHNWGYEVTGQ